MLVIDIFEETTIEGEETYLGDDYWYVTTLIEKSKDFEVFDLHLASLDLGIMPWKVHSIFQWVSHMKDIHDADPQYPVIMAPCGWVLNGWHRICKAILAGHTTIKAVRFTDMPKPDGKRKE